MRVHCVLLFKVPKETIRPRRYRLDPQKRLRNAPAVRLAQVSLMDSVQQEKATISPLHKEHILIRAPLGLQPPPSGRLLVMLLGIGTRSCMSI